MSKKFCKTCKYSHQLFKYWYCYCPEFETKKIIDTRWLDDKLKEMVDDDNQPYCHIQNKNNDCEFHTPSYLRTAIFNFFHGDVE